MNIQKSILIFIITTVLMPVPSLGQNCFSELIVSISSTDAISLEGFTVEIDEYPMITTHSGASAIDISEISTGSHSVKAYKDEGGYYFEGTKDITIPCINASARGQLRITVPVRLIRGPPNDGENEEDAPPK
jgi:hypothetical protein